MSGLLFMVSLTSCKDEKAQVLYSIICTEDVLDHVTPTVTYTDAKGNERIIELTKNDFQKATITDAKTRVSYSLPQYKIVVDYDSFGQEGECKVKFTRVKTEPEDKSLYQYYAQLYGSVLVIENKGGSTEVTGNVSMTIDEAQILMSKSRFDDAIESLTSDELRLTFSIDKKGKVTFSK